MRKTLEESMRHSMGSIGTGKHYTRGSFSGKKSGKFGVTGFANEARRAKGTKHNIQTKNLSKENLEFFVDKVEPHMKKLGVHAGGLGRRTIKKLKREMWNEGVKGGKISREDYKDFKKMLKGMAQGRVVEDVSAGGMETSGRQMAGGGELHHKIPGMAPNNIASNFSNSVPLNISAGGKDAYQIPTSSGVAQPQEVKSSEIIDPSRKDDDFKKLKKLSENLTEMDIG
jgi:hypothetical protein